jgi:hypothetical protein
MRIKGLFEDPSSPFRVPEVRRPLVDLSNGPARKEKLMIANNRFRYPTYTIRTKVLQVFGGSYDIYAPDGSLVLFASKKAFKLKEDIRLFSDKEKSEELLVIRARQIIDFRSAYDIEDATTHERVGTLKRKGFKSIARDEWIIMDADDKEVGIIQEDNLSLALLRRVMAMFVINLIPQSYRCEMNGEIVCTFRDHFNPLVKKIEVDFGDDGALGLKPRLDRRMGLAAAVLLCAIEGKQSG